MDISTLSGSNWFKRLEMDLISAVTSQNASKVQSAGTAATDPASSADPSTTTDAAAPTPAPPPPPPPAAPRSPLADGMLATLINLQSSRSLASQAASSLVQALDTDGDGSLSLAEANAAMGGSGGSDQTSKAAQGFAKLDTDGDGKLSADELTAAMQALEQSAQSVGGRRHHHHHHLQVADAQPTAAATPSTSATTDTAAATDTTATSASG